MPPPPPSSQFHSSLSHFPTLDLSRTRLIAPLPSFHCSLFLPCSRASSLHVLFCSFLFCLFCDFALCEAYTAQEIYSAGSPWGNMQRNGCQEYNTQDAYRYAVLKFSSVQHTCRHRGLLGIMPATKHLYCKFWCKNIRNAQKSPRTKKREMYFPKRQTLC